jgi:hypothetical protein
MRYHKIHIQCEPQESHKPPFFIGSQIRGAFGYALKQVTCINPSFTCEGCFATPNCLYHQFYEKKNTFHPYRFDFTLGKQSYAFSLYLFDDATMQLPYVVSALHKMLTQIGFGKERVTFQTFSMTLNGVSILKNNQITLPSIPPNVLQIDRAQEKIVLHLQTPLRMKKNNRFVRDVKDLELKDIVNSIYQRQMQLLGKGYKKFPYNIEGKMVSTNIHYRELTRRSNRQKSTMNLGGLMGEITIEGLNKESYEVLKVGELLGAGKSTVFGLGKIEVKYIKGEKSE